ncbi:hypothetical protein H920_07213 [Fukomys damarensis]|uniref:Prostate and testis expressed protein 4 n=1 Tax=Fukomys damarensis TaxID=885580 RepID=A0A091DLN0_FUKDA|nr:hypothetical protein H920_07213 [Fukomys damarensis]
MEWFLFLLLPGSFLVLCLSPIKEYVYRHSILACPKRCVEYVRITNWEKNLFFCCKENYCNNLSVKDLVPYRGILPEILS